MLLVSVLAIFSFLFFFFSSRRRHTRCSRDWSSDVCSSDLAERCVEGIEADRAQCEYWLERSPALVTALAPRIGYAEAAKLAKEAVAKNVTVRQLVMEKGVLKGKDLEAVLDLLAMTELGVPGERK